MKVFHEESDRREYLGMLGAEIARHGVSVLVWCLMTNHIHFVVVPLREDSLALGFGQAHWRYTRMKDFAAGVCGYLFQGRFNSCVLDESHLLAAERYVEQNPVRAGMTKVPWDYPRSSTLRKLTRTGRPAGNAAFVARVEKITGRDLRKGKPGRPRKRPT